MGGGDRYSIGVCNNDRRYPENILGRSHGSKFQFHGLPKDKKLRQIWHDKIRQNYIESAYIKICSNHFEDGERTFRCSVPTLFLTKSDVNTQQSPHKRCQTLRTPEDSGKKKRKVVKSETSLCDHILCKAKYGNEIGNPEFNLHVHNMRMDCI